MNNEDIIRELQKIDDTLTAVAIHLDAKDAMNAALHMSTEIRSTPLASAVRISRAATADLMIRLGTGASNQTEA